jgi:hypothetical protein
MNQSETINDLAGALAKAQAEIRNPAFDSTNPHFKNRYASLASHVDAVRAALPKFGLSVVQFVESPERDRVTVTTRILHASGQWIESCVGCASGAKVQELGSAVTYLRRYALAAICGIVGEDDDDGERERVAPRPQHQQVAQSPTPPPAVKPAKALANRLAAKAKPLEVVYDDEYIYGVCAKIEDRRLNGRSLCVVTIGSTEFLCTNDDLAVALAGLVGCDLRARVETRGEGKMQLVTEVRNVTIQKERDVTPQDDRPF